jgi:penicillin amidase
MQVALKRGGLSAGAAGAAKLLIDWDCVLSVDSPAAALYEVTAAKLTEAVIKDKYGALGEAMSRSFDAGAEEHWRRHLKAAALVAIEKGDDSLAPAGKPWADALSAAIESAVAELERRLGADRSKWRWGDLHKTGHQHPLAGAFPDAAEMLNPPRVETAGDGDTPWASGSKTGADYLTGTGPINRYIHDPSNWSNGRWIVPLGSSGHPGSPHYADQQQMWAKVAAIPQLWDWDQIGREAETEQALKKG